ncbi:DUF4258 domain-containing protein [Desulfatirhabdium butyrativorans]|uniref:DUF4258 domain-containing protein n=1 Tax=Desulfatirhabdium butyrativorans TaxID=340467 RepID=UPI0009FB9821|nr:DUF4258 domain-containing protein [Desulfatirhabdium butyrativorans]
MSIDIEWIRKHITNGEYLYRLHAAERASERNIDPLDVKEALINGDIIEQYPEDPRGKSCLVCGKTALGRILHILCGCSEDILWIITVYEPDPIIWSNDRKRRYSP